MTLNLKRRIDKLEETDQPGGQIHVIELSYGGDEDEARKKYCAENKVKVGPNDLIIYIRKFANSESKHARERHGN